MLIILAIVSLAVWWARDLRHGRRARQLVPAPGDESERPGGSGRSGPEAEVGDDLTNGPDGEGAEGANGAADGGPGHNGADGANGADGPAGAPDPPDGHHAPGDSDPVVRQFFATPAPHYESRRSQPRP